MTTRRARVELLESDPCWRTRFEEEAAHITAAIGPALVALEHVGSTAVPGLPAKPVIDVLAGLSRPLTSEEELRLRRLGYVSRSRARTARRYFRKGNPRTHYLHVVDWDSELWRGYVDLRDFLRTHPREAAAYAAVKLAAAAQAGPAHAAYAIEKARFLRALRKSAEFIVFRARLRAGGR